MCGCTLRCGESLLVLHARAPQVHLGQEGGPHGCTLLSTAATGKVLDATIQEFMALYVEWRRIRQYRRPYFWGMAVVRVCFWWYGHFRVVRELKWWYGQLY